MCGLLVTNISAQVQPGPSNNIVTQHLSTLKDQLDFLKNVAKQFPDPRLENLIQQAQKHLLDAHQASQKKQYRRASDEAKLTQNIINQALKMIITGPVNRLREKVDEKIRMVEKALRNNFNQHVQKLLQDAKQSRNRASQLTNRNVQKRVEWLRLAYFQAENALKLISSATGNVNLMSAIHEEKSNYDDLFRRAQNILQQNRINLAQQLFNQAINQYDKAETSASRGNLKQAIDSYRWASRLLLRVIDLSGESEVNWKRQAREELQITRESLRSIKQAVETQQNPRIQTLIQQATKVYLDAEHSFSINNFPETVRKAGLSRRVLNRVTQIIERRPGRAGFQFNQEYNTVKNLLDQLGQEFNPAENPAAQKMVETATTYLRRSETQHKANRQFLARANLYLATRFSFGLRSLLQLEQASENLQDMAIRRFENFQNRYLQMIGQYGDSTDRRVNIWLKLAEDIYNISIVAKNNGQYRVLFENVRVGQQILDRIEG